jgi:hypothetical protein
MEKKLPKLTKAQSHFLNRVQKTRQSVYFRRVIKTGKEECFIGRQRIHPRVWFFFFNIGYLSLSGKTETRLFEYYYMTIKAYKLDEYLDRPI